MTDESLVHIRWHTTEESYRDISRALEAEGATVEVEQERQDFVFVPIILAAVGAVGLARQILRLMREVKHHGIIIDARQTPLDIKEDTALPYGTIVVISAEGQRSERTDLNETSLADLIRALSIAKP